MTRLLHFVAISGLLLSSFGCCCLGGGGYGACYPPGGGGCPGGNCGIGAAAPGPGVAQQTFYNSYGTAQAITPGMITTSGPVALGPIIPGPVTYSVPTTTTTFLTTPTTTAALQPLPTY
jgi:hypothetical protein